MTETFYISGRLLGFPVEEGQIMDTRNTTHITLPRGDEA